MINSTLKSFAKKYFSTLNTQVHNSQNTVYSLQNFNEFGYQQKLDKSFTYFPTSTDLSQLEISLIQNLYKNLITYFSFPTKRERTQFLKKHNMMIDMDLLNKIETQINEYVLQGYKVKLDDLNNNNVFNIKHLGHLHLRGIDLEKDNNLFIHEYTYKRIENEVKFDAKKKEINEEDLTEEQKLKHLKLNDMNKAKNQKKLEMQQDLMESFKEHQDSAVRKKIKDVFGKFGYKYGENDKELFEAPEIKEAITNIQQKAFKTVNTAEGFVMIEDFLIQSNFGLKLVHVNDKQLNIEESQAETLQDEQQQQNDYLDKTLSFTHFMRTAYMTEGKEAPSVKNMNVRTILDLDGALYGNPPCKIKQF